MSWLYQPLLPGGAQSQAAGGTSPAIFFHSLRKAKRTEMQYLRQSTASQSVLIGPFVDSADGNTEESGLTIANTDIRLSKNGANIVAKNSGGGTHDELGYYTITLDATDTDTVGRLQLMVHATGALPVYHEYQVLEEAIFDGIVASSAGALATAAALATVDGIVDDILLDTAEIANLNDIAVSDILTTALADVYAANGDQPTLQQAIMAIHQHLMAFAISGTAYSVKKLDGSTEAFSGTLDDATSPTSNIRS